MSTYNHYKRPYYTKLFKEAFDDVRAYVKKQYQERFDQSPSSFHDLTEIKMEKIGRRGDVTDCQSFLLAAFEEDNLVVLEGEKEIGTAVSQKLAMEWAKKESGFPMFDLVLYAMHGGVETTTEETIELVCEWMSKNQFILPRHHSFLLSLSYQMTSSNKQFLKSHEVDPDGKVRLLLIIDGYDHAKPKCKELEFALQSTESYRFDYKILLTTLPGSITGEICPAAFGCILPVSMLSVSQNPPEYLKDHVASIFDDFQITKQMVSCLNAELVVPFLHGWCLDVATCSEICNTNETNRRLAVKQLKSGIQLYLRDRDEMQTDLLDEFKDIIEAFEQAKAGDTIINMLKAKIGGLTTADASVAGSSQIHNENIVPKQLHGNEQLPEVGKLVALVKDAYKDQFKTINPLPFEPEIELKLDDCWINLELENTKVGRFKNTKQAAVTVGGSMTYCLAKVLQAFSNAKVLICKGDPGCGKSTLCYYLCYKWAIGDWGKDFDIVIFARLRDVEKTESILELGANWMAKFGFCRDKDLLSKTAEETKSLVILDGYDESLWTDKEGKVRGICSELEDLLESTPCYLPFNLLLTSCSWAVDNDRIKHRGKAQNLIILPLMPYQQEEYAGKIIQNDRKVKKLLESMMNTNDDSLKKLCHNILHFSYICFCCKTYTGDDFEFPFKSLDQLYSHLFTRLVDRYEEKQMNKAPWNWETLPQIRQLGKMAMAGMGKEYRNPQISFTIDDLHEFKIDEKYCTGAGLLTKKFYKNTGSSSVVYYYSFAQEYLARKFVFDIYKEIAKTYSFNDNTFGGFVKARAHPDMRDVVDRLERFLDSTARCIDLVGMATEDHENILPIALVFMDKNIFSLSYCTPYLSTLCDLLDSQSDHSPSGITISRARDAFKRFIKDEIIKRVPFSAAHSDEEIADVLEFCHKVDFPFRRVFYNGNTEHQSIALLYFPTRKKALHYVKSSVLERFKHPIDTINIADRDLSVIDYMGIQENVTVEDLLRSPRLPISHIGRIGAKYSADLQFSHLPSLSQSHPSAEDNGETQTITVSEVVTRGNLLPALKYFHSLHPPPLISSIGFRSDDLEEYCRNAHDWESVSSLFQNYDKMKLGPRFWLLDDDFPMSEFIEYIRLFENLRHVDLTECNLDDEYNISEEDLKIFLDWLHPLLVDPSVSVQYDHDSRLGGRIDQYLSSVSNVSASVTH